MGQMIRFNLITASNLLAGPKSPLPPSDRSHSVLSPSSETAHISFDSQRGPTLSKHQQTLASFSSLVTAVSHRTHLRSLCCLPVILSSFCVGKSFHTVHIYQLRFCVAQPAVLSGAFGMVSLLQSGIYYLCVTQSIVKGSF